MTLMERDNLLREPEELAKAPQVTGGIASIAGFDLIRAQRLLYRFPQVL
jgi:hypothetical protein